MFGLQRDFTLNGGVFMIVNQEPELGPEDLNPVQSGMIMSNRIKGLLGVMVKEVDYRIELQYDITGQRMLAHLWKNGNISMNLFYEVIYQIANTLHSCGQYLLDMNHFILHEEYMFITENERSFSVSLTYVPLRRSLYEGSSGAQIKQLIIRMIPYVSELEGDGVQRMLQVCDGEMFNPGKLKEVLLQYIHPETDSRTKGSVHNPVAVKAGDDLDAGRKLQALRGKQDNESIQEKSYDRPLFTDISRPARVRDSFPEHATAGRQEEDEAGEDDEDDSFETETVLYKYRLYVALGCLLGAAVIWKYVYLEDPGTIRLLICAFITVGMAGFALLSWMGWSLTGLFRRGQEQDMEIPGEEEQKPAASLRRRIRFSAEREAEGEEPWRWMVQEEARQPEYPPLALEEENRYDRHEADEDTAETESPLSPATTLLQDKGGNVPEGVRVGAYLRRVAGKSGPAEDIPVRSGSFIIGRSQETAQYVDWTEGVSRSHVELSLHGNGETPVLKDLASTNGTRLNGSPMVPYKEYPLNDGDTFELAGVAYTYFAA